MRRASPLGHEPEPVRLCRESSATATALKGYAARTRPGPRAGVAAWYRLAAELPETDGGAWPAPRARPWLRSWALSVALTAAAGTILLIAQAPALPPPPAVDSWGAGGNSGSSPRQGTGGSRGASGAQGAGGTAATAFAPPLTG
jgi:hypothetical protein